MEKAKLLTYQKWIIAGIFLAFLSIASISFQDYGIAWDEPAQMEIGQFNYEYLLGKSDTLSTYHDRFYGAAYEMPLYALQQLLNIDNSRNLFYFRHLINHLIFILGLGFFFALLLRLFRNFNASLLGVLMLYLHPRIFAHSFFNSKDIVFMSVFIIGLYSLFLLLEKQSRKRIIIHALVSALLLDIRIIGIILPAISFIVLLPLQMKRDEESKALLPTISLYSLSLIAFSYLFWPALWTDPLLLGKSFARMSHFPFQYNILFAGNMIPATQVPWNYIPIWIGITTPPFILLLTSIGLPLIVINYFRNTEEVIHSKKDWFVLILTSFPIDFIIVLIILGSSLYDGWRQVFFLYPMLVLSAVYAYDILIKKLIHKKIAKGIINSLIIVFLLLTVVKIYKLHPYEQVYFNHFVSKKNETRRKTFEMDYWGLSFREALEYIVIHDNSAEIKIYFSNAAGPINIMSLPKEAQSRISEANNMKDADYFITNYRYHPEDYNLGNAAFHIKRDNTTILSIYKLKN